MNIGILSGVAAAVTATKGFAQSPQAIDLPPPMMEGGKSLMQALKERRSIRDYSEPALLTQNTRQHAVGRLGHQPHR